jgi:murein DD-endopeptidase MepM/ murein hydrolase activator NlpD
MAGTPRGTGASPVTGKGTVKPPFPKQHLVLVAALALVLGSLLIFPSDDVKANRKEIPIELALEPLPQATPDPIAPPAEPWSEYKVRNGDNLSLLFQRAGLNDADVYHITRKADGGKALTKIYPGQTLGIQLDQQGDLKALRYQKSKLSSVTFRREGDSYAVEENERQPERRQTYASARIDSSLFLAGEAAGMSANTIMELANIFGGVIDFVLDPRKGDTFYVLYEELYLDGEKFSDGQILAAEFVNRGKSHTAFIYQDEQGRTEYFSENGVSMRKAFMLAPLDFTRVSSNFNLRRLHPIYKTTRPHRGTDYAASRGTPVFAAGDGRVTEAGYTKANGNYVIIQHGEQFTTKYLHLHKRKVKKGARVSQHQVIGTVGSTGAATGPHLHYEFLVNGVHRNPRTIHKKLPKARSLNASELISFQEQTRHLNLQLASIRQTRTAMLETTGTSKSVL